VDTPGDKTNIQTIFDVCPRVLELVRYRNRRVHYSSFQPLKNVAVGLVDEVRNRLNHMMPDGWIGRGTPISWPPRSPDLTPLYFFLCGYGKNLVCSMDKA
jgi:hypothetical protein